MMQDKVKIKGHEDLLRDTSNQAVISTDLSSLENYRARRNKQRETDNKLNEIDDLKSEIKEIKSLLRQLVGEK